MCFDKKVCTTVIFYIDSVMSEERAYGRLNERKLSESISNLTPDCFTAF